MRLNSNLAELPQTRTATDVFGGYNHNLRIPDGEWYNEQNLTSAHFPMFSQRSKRAAYLESTPEMPLELNGIIAKEALAWVEGTKLYYNGKMIDGITLANSPKQIVSMGAYICIFPDGVYVNTADLSDYGSMAAFYTSEGKGSVTLEPSRADGTAYDMSNVIVGAEAPGDPQNGAHWIDTSVTPHALKQYSETSAMWVQIPTVYVKISCQGIGAAFSRYDGVALSGIASPPTDDSIGEQLAALNMSTIIQACTDDYIIVTGMLDRVYEQTEGIVTVERRLPEMQYVCESNNRLYGCYYGMQGGVMLNEIYACKLGDFKNWECYQGISSDSYRVSIGSDGNFTGCVAHLGYPLFFKENFIHKLTGTMPANFQLHTTGCRGVQDGSAKSLAVVNEVLYYKSRSDVVAYDGSLPTGVSPNLGTELYYDAVAGAHGGKYYISMRDGEDAWHMFVYDTQRGVWHREDNTHASGFAAWGDELFYIDADNRAIMAENGTKGVPEGDVRWMAESGVLGYEMIDHQYVSRFNLRMRLGLGASCKLALEYDSSGRWIDQGTVYGRTLDSFVIPVIPQRCDHFRMRLSGTGDVKIYSIAKILEQGSDC